MTPLFTTFPEPKSDCHMSTDLPLVPPLNPVCERIGTRTTLVVLPSQPPPSPVATPQTFVSSSP